MQKSSRNKTITLDLNFQNCFTVFPNISLTGTIQGNCLEVLPKLPEGFVDLLFLDPPYNISKKFSNFSFSKKSLEDYENYLEEILLSCIPKLKPTASVYICSDWFTSTSVFTVASKYFNIRNRITWEREKGRGSKTNWKNSHEDIFYCTLSDNFVFNVDVVKLRKRVLAPYTKNGVNKDWESTEKGNFRDTYPSNFWSDITIPFWSMSENTDHPTQKSEKLLAKIILASSNKGDFILDPFLGSGTTSVVAKKLDRKYLGIELQKEYCMVSEQRLLLADKDKRIQGYDNNLFYERNSKPCS